MSGIAIYSAMTAAFIAVINMPCAIQQSTRSPAPATASRIYFQYPSVNTSGAALNAIATSTKENRNEKRYGSMFV